jgi:ketosteroid isomerase-like protein
VFTITDGLDRGERAKRRFYKTLVRLLQEGPGVRPADVFVMMTVTPPENFSFADGVTGTDVVAAEALDTAAKSPGSRETYTKAEMAYAITELLGHRDSSRILPMLRQDFVLKIPATLPYGGEFTGPEAFARFFAGTPGGAEVWESFDVHVDQVMESADYLVAQLTNTAVPKATGKTVVLQNVWLFEVAGGRLVSAQLYADTAAVRSSAGAGRELCDVAPWFLDVGAAGWGGPYVPAWLRLGECPSRHLLDLVAPAAARPGVARVRHAALVVRHRVLEVGVAGGA